MTIDVEHAIALLEEGLAYARSLPATERIDGQLPVDMARLAERAILDLRRLSMEQRRNLQSMLGPVV